MNKREVYEKGKEIYNKNLYEYELEDLYIKIDDLLDELEDRRMEIKVLIEEKKEAEITPEDKLQKLYEELSVISSEIDSFDHSPVEALENEQRVFYAKNKYRFMQVEEAEKKYALAVEKGDDKKKTEPMLEALKRLRMDTLHIQKEQERYNEKISKAKEGLLKLQTRREKILQNITSCQQEIHQSQRKESEELERIKNVLVKKKLELDKLKRSIQMAFFDLGKAAYDKGFI